MGSVAVTERPQPPEGFESPQGFETTPHDPVLVDRIVGLLVHDQPRSEDQPCGTMEPWVLVDATVGAAGHAAALMAAAGPAAHLVGFDRDPDALELAGRRLAAYGDRVHLVHAGYDAMSRHVAPLAERIGPVAGILYDLGVSSMQLDRPDRGFSFRADAPLDMRMDPATGPTAADLVNTLEAVELERIIRSYGEERLARRIAQAIVRARPLSTTRQLADVVERAVPHALRGGRSTGPRMHPATRTFQALRIEVNAELDRFSASLPQALELLGLGGRMAVLSYHSLEDRIAKRFFSDAATGCICPPDLPVCGCGRVPLVRAVVRGAERPPPEEIVRNPRARAAKLRVIEKTRHGRVLEA